MTLLRRRGAVAATVFLVLVAGAIGLIRAGGGGGRRGASPAAGPQPNIVVIMTDDQTTGEMRAMPRTRRLIVRAGVSFRRFYVTDPLCCPSRATFLTGQYAHNHGVRSNLGPHSYPALRQGHTLGVWLQRANYWTALAGKFLNSYGLHGSARHVPPGWSDWHGLLDPGIENYYDYSVDDNGTVNRHGSARRDYKTDVVGRDAVRAVRRSAGGPDPLFLFVAFTAPHAPSVPAPGDAGTFAAPRPPRTPASDERDVADKPSFLRDLPPLSAAAKARISSRRERSLESLVDVDRQVAAIVGALRDAGELQDTYLLFTSDNGYLDGEHRIEFGKLLAYEPSSRVPLFVRGPGIPAARTSSALVGNVDLAPTILGLAGAAADLPQDGRSLLDLARHPGRSDRRAYLIESLVHDPSTFYGYRYRAIRAGRYLYVRYSTGDRELYDLARDPFELRNRAGSASYAAPERVLAPALDRLSDCSGGACHAALKPPPPAGG